MRGDTGVAGGMIRTIGIDPGSRYTGYGLMEGDGSQLRHLDNGTIRVPTRFAFPDRLKYIYDELSSVIGRFRPTDMAVEEVFFAKNVQSALRLGQARGAAMLAGVNAGLAIHEYSALQIKQAVVGYGRAGKDQIVQMIRHLCCLREAMDPNAADALAAAICHLNTRSSRARWNDSGSV